MKNLGKNICILFIFLTTTIYANVTARVEPAVVYKGESATYLLTINGGQIKKPAITKICGNDIVGSSSQTSIEMVNGDYKKSYILSYEFVPKKSCVVKPVTVKINGKKERSNRVKVVVKPASQDKDASFLLSLTTSKKSLFVGEPFVVHLELKQNKRATVIDSKFIEPDFKGFWVKSKSEATREETPEYIITHASYTLAPQREGNLTIKPAQLRIATRSNGRDMWGSFIPQIKWKSYYSNALHIEAKPLPNNAKIVGNFTITASADKDEITPNEAVNVTVTVKGEGNLEDIGTFKPYIDGVNVFAEKINIKGDTLTQKLAFVSDKDFIIPPFKLAFYNLKTKRVEQIKTAAIKIKVKGSAKANTTLNIQKGTEPKVGMKQAEATTLLKGVKTDYLWLSIAFALGLIVGIFLMLLKSIKIKKREKNFNIKDEKLLLLKLLPYKDSDEDVQKIITTLEGKFYGEKKENIDKKLLKKVIKKYDIS
jgi:hypothetical protein